LDDYVWEKIKTPEELLAKRMAAMREFLDDYDTGKKEGRYVNADITKLPFRKGEFGIALCSHFLFLYDALGLTFHLKAIYEMLRVAKEVRIFPVKDMRRNATSRFLAPVLRALKKDNYRAGKIAVDYEFQKGAYAMLKITRDVAEAR